MRKLLIISLLALTVGCIHKKGGTAVTPMERVTTDNAVFAQLDDSIEQGAEAVAASGLLKADQVAPVIAWAGTVAQAHQQITAILAKGSNVSASDFLSINAIVQQIHDSGIALVDSGDFGIKNPKSQQTIAADITAVTNLANALLKEIQALVPLPPPGSSTFTAPAPNPTTGAA